MAKGFKCGAGGGAGGVNFKVVAYESADLLPASASENTIAVITADPISSWIFSPTEPEAPAEGMAWITTALSSTVAFNAMKKNTLTVFPVTVSQYVAGVWEPRTAKSFQAGAWVDWVVCLYDNGVRSEGYGWTEKKTPAAAVVEYEENRITVATVGQQTSEAYVVVGPIDLTQLDHLRVTGNFGLASDGEYRNIAVLFVASTSNASYKNAAAITSYFTGTAENLPAGYEYNLELDVRSLTGAYYVYAGTNTQGSAWYAKRTNYITKITGGWDA